MPFEKTEKIWMDGELVPWDEARVHVLTHSLHYGSGVFEGIRTYAAANSEVYLDYYSELAEGRNFKRALTSDGFLPNEAGYGAMASLAERAIADAQKGLKTP